MDKTDWIRRSVSFAGMERIEAQFSGHAYDPHRHDDYAVGFTISGHQSFRYRGVRNDSFLGQTIVIHPDEIHDGQAGSQVGFRYRMIYVPPRLVLNALPEGLSFLPFAPNPVASDLNMLKALRRVLSNFTEPLDDLVAVSFLTELSDALLRRQSGFSEEPRSGLVDTALLRRVAEYLREEQIRPITSIELERMSNLSRFQLARHFKRQYGTTPDRYRLMRKLERGRELLAAGASIAEAAALCGFADQPHFTRHFLRAYGMTPGRWNRLTKSSPSEDLRLPPRRWS